MKKLSKKEFKTRKWLFLGYSLLIRQKEREFTKFYNEWEEMCKKLFGIDYDGGFYILQDIIFNDNINLEECFNDMIKENKKKCQKKKKRKK